MNLWNDVPIIKPAMAYLLTLIVICGLFNALGPREVTLFLLKVIAIMASVLSLVVIGWNNDIK